MKIYALVGESGTGKSHRAMQLAFQNKISCVIDDGLLICQSKKIAGKSAKREHSKVAAVKRAIFFNKEHAHEVKRAIEKLAPESLLLIGTSNKMVETIAQNLELPKISTFFYIEDLATEAEIQLAREHRTKYGKHVIPLPTVEIKKDFSGYFLDPIRMVIGRRGQVDEVSEKTIVRPTFSYLGNFTVSNKVIIQIVTVALNEHSFVSDIFRIRLQKTEDGIKLAVDLGIHPLESLNLLEQAEQIQKHVIEAIDHMTKIQVISVQIYIKDLKYS